MAYKPPKQTIVDNDLKYAPSNEAVFEALKLKLDEPTVSGTNGQLLQLTGYVGGEATTSWVNPPSSLPSQSGNANKILITDGTNVSWQYPGIYTFGTYYGGTIVLGRSVPTSFSGDVASSATDNIIIGNLAGNSITLARNNVFIGTSAGQAFTTGGINRGNSVGIGYQALSNTTGGSYGQFTAIGYQALQQPTGHSSTALGFLAGRLAQGERNTFVGALAGSNGAGGQYITAVGADALKNNIASNNTAFGTFAGEAVTTGSGNLLLGYAAGNAITTGSNNTIIGTVAGTTTLSDTIILAAGTTERMRITSAGNVLIGTDTSAGSYVRLQLSSNTFTTEIIDSYNNASAFGAALLFRSARGTAAAPTASQQNDELGWVGAYGYGASAFSAASRAAISMLAAENWTAAAQGTNITFRTTSTGSTTTAERMRIDSSGNVGINNSAPSRQLTIQNTTASQPATFGLLNTTNLAAGGGTYEAGSVEFLTNDVLGGLTAPVALSKISSIADNSASTVPGGILAFFSNQEGANQTQLPIERMRITSAGNVGIGTTSPSNLLHTQQTSATTNAVTNVLRVDSQSSGTPATGIGVGIEMAVETAAGNTEVGVVLEAVTTDVTAASEDFDFVVKTMANGAVAAERMRVKSDGSVNASEFRVPNYRLDPHTHNEGTETGNFTINWANGAVHSVTLNAAGPLVVTLNNPVNGGAYALRIIQGATPGTVTWPASVKWPGGTPPTLSTTTGDVDIVNFLYYADTGFYYGTFAGDFS